MDEPNRPSAPENPYRQRRAFVGRRAELAALTSLLGEGQSTLLIGGRRTGKTALLERIPEPARPIVRCDAAGWDLRSEGAVLEAMASAVIRQRGLSGLPHPATREDLEEVLAEVVPLVLAIDEADRLLGEPWSGGFLSFLRYLDDTALRWSISFLLAGGPMLAAYRNPDDRGSPPLNTAEAVFLAPLARDEVAELAAIAGRPIDLDRLWTDAGGHPSLLSAVLARIYDGWSYDDAIDGVLDGAPRDFKVWHRQLGDAGRAFIQRLPEQGVERQALGTKGWLPLREGYVLAKCTCLIRIELGRIRPGPRLFSAWMASEGGELRDPTVWDLAISLCVGGRAARRLHSCRLEGAVPGLLRSGSGGLPLGRTAGSHTSQDLRGELSIRSCPLERGLCVQALDPCRVQCDQSEVGQPSAGSRRWATSAGSPRRHRLPKI